MILQSLLTKRQTNVLRCEQCHQHQCRQRLIFSDTWAKGIKARFHSRSAIQFEQNKQANKNKHTQDRQLLLYEEQKTWGHGAKVRNSKQIAVKPRNLQYRNENG